MGATSPRAVLDEEPLINHPISWDRAAGPPRIAVLAFQPPDPTVLPWKRTVLTFIAISYGLCWFSSFFSLLFYFCLRVSLMKGVISAAINQPGYQTRAMRC